MSLLVALVLSLPLIGAYAIFAVGIVVIYRASRVLNLAHGAMAMVPAYVNFSLVRAHVPLPVAVILSITAGAAIGVVVERVFVRGLRHMSLTAQTVGTVAVLSFLISIAAKVWGTAPQKAPGLFPSGHIGVGAGILQYGAIGLFVVAILLAAVMLLVFARTNLGLMMRGAAESRLAAALMGVNPDRTTAVAWAIGGGMAAIAGILLAAVTTLDPFGLPLQTLPAFVAALLGGIESLPGALTGSAVVGALLGIVPATSDLPVIGAVTGQTGGPELALTIVALGVMYLRGQRLSVAERGQAGVAARAGAGRTVARRPMPLPAVLVALAALAAWVWIPGVPFSVLANVNQAMAFALVGVSLVILTGWVGQISLGHAALVGIGAFGTGVLARNAISFPFNLPLAMAFSAGAAILLGAVALRVRGLYLAVATLIFSWMADSFLFRASWFVGPGGSSTIDNVVFGSAGGFPSFDLSDRKILYYFGLAITGLALLAAANLRSSKTGRAFFATRGSETAAASLGIDVMRYKLLAFAISGALAGAAGNLTMIDQRSIVPDQFAFTVSLFYLSIAVMGGLTRLGGVVLASLLFAGLSELFFRVTALSGYLQVVSSSLLVAALLAQAHASRFEGLMRVVRRAMERTIGFARPPRAVRRTMEGAVRFAWRRAHAASGAPGVDVVTPPDTEPGVTKEDVSRTGLDERKTARMDTASRTTRGRGGHSVVLSGSGITVRFGGLVAVSDASLEIRAGEIVGLIGPNGAGKTTLFNALSGLVQPAAGSVTLFGMDVSRYAVHERACLGLSRTFQALQLFGDLTVRENLLVATHVHNRTGFVRHILASDEAARAERVARNRVREVIETLDLRDVADRPASGLPFGILRVVELARAVVTEAPMILLDEPASGLDNAETDRFTSFLGSLRDRLGISMLLIEHDVRMVTGVSDYIYVLNMGRIIAEGPPDRIQRDPAVVAAYLGSLGVETESSPSPSQPVREPA